METASTGWAPQCKTASCPSSSNGSHAHNMCDLLTTRYVDDTLLAAMQATSVNSINKGDYRQVGDRGTGVCGVGGWVIGEQVCVE